MLQFIVDTLIRTADLALIALGLSLVYGLVKFPNIAQVQYAMLGAYLTGLFIHLHVPLVMAIAFSVFLVAILSVLVHHLIFRRLLQVGPAQAMIGALALSMILVALVLGFAGSAPLSYGMTISQAYHFADATITPSQIWTVLVTLLLLIGFSGLLFNSSLGRSIRALSGNRALAAASGLNADAITHCVNFLSGALAALGGSLLAMNSSAYVNQGNDLLLPILASAILGGLGNPLGAVLGALLIAVSETLVTSLDFTTLTHGLFSYFPITYINAASFVILLLALIWRPYGLFNREIHRV
jgi:neutral amino acid transport system permease protein